MAGRPTTDETVRASSASDPQSPAGLGPEPDEATDAPSEARRRVLAVASGGGHWIQLQRALPAVDSHEVHFLGVDARCRASVGSAPFHLVGDANRDTRAAMVRQILATGRVVWRLRPDVILTTGASVGFWALFFGKILGAQTIWIDSLANAERLSVSGRLARFVADLWLTQWPQVSRPEGPHYHGSLL